MNLTGAIPVMGDPTETPSRLLADLTHGLQSPHPPEYWGSTLPKSVQNPGLTRWLWGEGDTHLLCWSLNSTSPHQRPISSILSTLPEPLSVTKPKAWQMGQNSGCLGRYVGPPLGPVFLKSSLGEQPGLSQVHPGPAEAVIHKPWITGSFKQVAQSKAWIGQCIWHWPKSESLPRSPEQM